MPTVRTRSERTQPPSIASEEAILRVRGGKPLNGEITLMGAKNSVSKCMVAALLTDEPCTLHNVPDIEDVTVVTKMIEAMGGEVTRVKDGTLRISAKNIKPVHHRQLKDISKRSRIPVLFAGPLLHRFGTAMIPALGGCNIGPRPVDFHTAALIKLGASVTEVPKGMHITARALEGTRIKLPYPSVGTTEQVLLAAVRARGVTELSNAAVEPEIIDLIALLQKMGAIISVDTDRVITIIGVSTLRGFTHTIIFDRIEAVSWACAAAATNGRILVKGARQLDMTTFLNKFQQVGGAFEVTEEGIIFSRGKELRSIAIETDVHPGFMTDWQQPFVVLLTQAKGASVVHETVYEERFGFIEPLNRMGASIQLYRECLGSNRRCRFGQKNHFHSAVIMGPTPLSGADITVPDLRAGFSYVIAALTATGESTLHRIDIIQRGYENFVEKLRTLGADVALS